MLGTTYLFESLSSRPQASSSLRPLPWCPESQNILAYVDNDMVIATLGPLHHLKCCVQPPCSDASQVYKKTNMVMKLDGLLDLYSFWPRGLSLWVLANTYNT